MTELKPQKRARKISMTSLEIDAFLSEERTCRVATSNEHGPHVTALWFAWDGRCIWLCSVTRAQRWSDLQKDARLSILVDAGREHDELRGVEILGTAEIVGEVPRIGEPVEELVNIELQMGRKYLDGHEMIHDGKHGWLKVTPTKIVSWDFRKL
jgi:Pyridoxamine 5'-phosphate oxidase